LFQNVNKKSSTKKAKLFLSQAFFVKHFKTKNVLHFLSVFQILFLIAVLIFLFYYLKQKLKAKNLKQKLKTLTFTKNGNHFLFQNANKKRFSFFVKHFLFQKHFSLSFLCIFSARKDTKKR